MYVEKLEDIVNAGAERVGGKAANLAKMMGQGFPVPPGFVITTPAYAEQLERLLSREFPRPKEQKQIPGSSKFKGSPEEARLLR